ncbi:hypothetical protein DFH07DRAFT_962781 [Mycena maculata]|uniref:Extracellular membrane protein CFEM domain-containing protein n=1 Tax=Mycena maculata TaxID=230809 RepID=A0AAD7N5W6_9AGAR|nr:hypothetical protein DFH07DRAFT_962781 [Mycena maculata]
MFSKVISAALLVALAGRALAVEPFLFNFTVGTDLFFANETLVFDYTTSVISGCEQQCQNTQTSINACAQDDFECLCQSNLTGALNTCENCIFTALIDANKPLPNPLAGENQVMAGWTANCVLANIPITSTFALVLPASWDGPFVAVFPVPVAWVIAVTGGLLGSSLIYMICNM